MKEIAISEIQIIPVKPNKGLVAFASCVINDQFYAGDIAIYTRPNGEDYRLVYPCKVLPNGKKINCFHPINREAADHLKEQIVGVFLNLSEKVKKSEGKGGSENGREG
jgi:DNA-binding cell septation regulator SpoVG